MTTHIYDHLISIGLNCETRYQLKQKYGAIDSSLLEWAAVSPKYLSSVIRNPNLIFSAEIEEDPNVNMWRCKATNISFHGKSKPKDLLDNNGKRDKIKVAKEKEDTVSRIKYLSKKFITIAQSPDTKLYILGVHPHYYSYDFKKEQFRWWVQTIFNAIQEIAQNASLLVICTAEFANMISDLNNEHNFFVRTYNNWAPHDKATIPEYVDLQRGKELLSEFKPKDVKEDTKVYKFEKEDTMSQNNLLNNTNTTKNNVINPASDKNNIPVIFSCDANFIPYLGVCIQSLINSSSDDHNYDILILEDLIPDWQKERLKSLIKGRENISMRFINITPYFDEYRKRFYIRDRYTLSTYARFFIPDILEAYDKIVYLDADTIIKKDIAELYNIDIGNNLLGGALDYAVHINWYAGMMGVEKYKYAYNYLSKTAHLNDISGYFQAGVLIMNLEECRKTNLLKKCINFFNYIEKPLLVDQDVLNFVCKEKVKIIDQRWNFQWHLRLGEYNSLRYLPYEMFESISQVFDDFYLIHYCSNTRPWTSPNQINAHFFWDTAKQTIFYEELLYANINKSMDNILQIEKHRLNYQPLFDIINYHKLQLLYWKYKIKKHLMLSKKKKEKYKIKAKEIKTALKNAKKILKEHE